LFTHPNVGNADGTKGTGCVLYFLIAVHEEADDEYAHAQLIADRFHLRYRDTFLTMSSEMTRALLKTESWVADWLEFFFRSTLSFFLSSGMNTENNLLGKNEIDGRDALVAKWPRLVGRRTRTVILPSSDGNGAFASAVLGKGFPFITAAGL
jgi:hypothetical protein